VTREHAASAGGRLAVPGASGAVRRGVPGAYEGTAGDALGGAPHPRARGFLLLLVVLWVVVLLLLEVVVLVYPRVALGVAPLLLPMSIVPLLVLAGMPPLWVL